MTCAVFRVPRSTVYLMLAPAAKTPAVVAKKRGPMTRVSDSQVVEEIRRQARAAVDAPPWLLVPRRLGPPNGDPAHAGTITTTRPDEMWGTDATRFYTEDDGW